ncbi:MAG: glycerol-3-phosphate acyltransferase, partial [Candidatus Omnitrophica bacterium]|nr:glycerol-3-phosphate acyltransferase [Candidatus Omnitrophota bacterium]
TISFSLALALWVAMFFSFRYVSLASLTGGASFFGITLFLNVPCEIKIFSFLVFIFVVIRHKKNIGNLISKKELRF